MFETAEGRSEAAGLGIDSPGHQSGSGKSIALVQRAVKGLVKSQVTLIGQHNHQSPLHCLASKGQNKMSGMLMCPPHQFPVPLFLM